MIVLGSSCIPIIPLLHVEFRRIGAWIVGLGSGDGAFGPLGLELEKCFKHVFERSWSV